MSMSSMKAGPAGEEASILRHPLVSTLLWAWQKFNGVPADQSQQDKSRGSDSTLGKQAGGTGSPRSGTKSDGDLGLMWQEEYGGHLDLYAEYFTELKKGQVGKKHTESLQNKENKDTSGTDTPNYSPFATPSPGNWGWYIPITPPREGMFGNTHSPASKKGFKVVVAAQVKAPTSSPVSLPSLPEKL
jgi:hypothetical protein